jgi:hypothetical protein
MNDERIASELISHSVRESTSFNGRAVLRKKVVMTKGGSPVYYYARYS